jgi:hypothetical protein
LTTAGPLLRQHLMIPWAAVSWAILAQLYRQALGSPKAYDAGPTIYDRSHYSFLYDLYPSISPPYSPTATLFIVDYPSCTFLHNCSPSSLFGKLELLRQQSMWFGVLALCVFMSIDRDHFIRGGRGEVMVVCAGMSFDMSKTAASCDGWSGVYSCI